MSIASLTRSLSCQLLFAACALAQSTVAFQNDSVKVISAFQKPRERTPMHEHKFNRVIVFEQAGKQEFINMRSKPTYLEFKAGEVIWSPVTGMHSAQVVSDLPVPMVEIEIKKPGNPSLLTTGPLDPVIADPKHYKVEFDNDQVRVLRVIIGPHESTPAHEHNLNRVVVYLTNQDFRVTSTDGKVEHVTHNAGEVSWAGPAAHKEENLSDKPFEVVVAELKLR
jgi:quercetin dioxygenase-like cupin family protein